MPIKPFSVASDASTNFYLLYTGDYYLFLKEIIHIRNNLLSVMGLQNQAFKNCKKWMPAYKKWVMALNQCLSSYLNIIYQNCNTPHLIENCPWSV